MEQSSLIRISSFHSAEEVGNSIHHPLKRNHEEGSRNDIVERVGPTSLVKKKALQPSFIWNHFVKETNGKFVVCLLCPDGTTRFAYSGGTSTMNRHLRKKHQKYAPGKTAADYDKTSNDTHTSSSNKACSGVSSKKSKLINTMTYGGMSKKVYTKLIISKLVMYLVSEYHPLALAHRSTEFIQFLQMFDFKFKIPSESNLRIVLTKIHAKQRDALKKLLLGIEYINLSLCEWISVFYQRILVFSAHWINNQFQRRDCVLEVYVLPIDEQVDITVALTEIISKWKLGEKITTITVGNQSEDVKSVALPKRINGHASNISVIYCLTTILDQAVTCGLTSCKTFISKCRKFVSFFLQNPSENHQLQLLQQKSVLLEGNISNISSHSHGMMHQHPLSVICDYENSWNSTCEMISRLVELEDFFVLYKQSLTSHSDRLQQQQPIVQRFLSCELSHEDWQILKEMNKLLEPLERFIHVSDDDYPSLSLIHPVLYSLKNHLRKAQWISTSIVRQVKESILRNLVNSQRNEVDCLVHSGRIHDSNQTRSIACLLDPRFKSLSFLGIEERFSIIEELRSMYLNISNANTKEQHLGMNASNTSSRTNENVVCTGGESKKIGLLSELFPPSEDTTAGETVKTEVDVYLESPAQAPREQNDPLIWWGRYQTMFPHLSCIARKYLSIPSSSIPFSMIFSNSGRALLEKRSRIETDLVAQYVFSRSAYLVPEIADHMFT